MTDKRARHDHADDTFDETLNKNCDHVSGRPTDRFGRPMPPLKDYRRVFG